MNSTLKVLVVAALIIAVAAVMAVKRGRDKTASTPPTAATTTGAALETPSNLPRLVDLGSTTCIPCKAMAPILEEIQKEYEGRLEVSFIDVRKIPDAATQFKIQLIPTQIFYDSNGQERYRHEGFLSKDDILAKWREIGVSLETSQQSAQTAKGGQGR